MHRYRFRAEVIAQVNLFWGLRERYRYSPKGEFYCPGCRQTVGCLRIDTVQISRILFVPVYRRVADSGWVKCPLCGEVFGRQMTAFSPSVSNDGLKPALVSVLLLMMAAGKSDTGVDRAFFSRIVAEVTGNDMGPEAIRQETDRLLSEKDALGDALRPIAPYLTNAQKRMILESASRVVHADGVASEKEMDLMRQMGSLLDVPDSIYRRVTGGSAF